MGVHSMSSSEELELDDQFEEDSDNVVDDDAAPSESSKTNLTKRLIIDSLLEDRRLRKKLDDYDFDLDSDD